MASSSSVRKGDKSYNEGLCFEFSIFNDCKFSEKCKRMHQCDAYQTLLLGRVDCFTTWHRDHKFDKLVIKLITNTDVVRTYLVPAGPRFTKDAKPGDLVIFQESSRRIYSHGQSDAVSYGKVLTVLQNLSHESTIPDIRMESCLKHAFAIDRPGTRFRSGVSSIERCIHHGRNCKRIGYHTSAIALSAPYNRKQGEGFVPIYRESGVVGTFSTDTIQLAISVYAHSESELVEGPLISSVVIDRRDVLIEGEIEKYREKLDLLWFRFVCDTFIAEAAQTWISNFIINSPDSWKEQIAMHRLRAFFDKQVTNFLKCQRGFFVLAQNLDAQLMTTKEEVLIPAKFVNEVENAWKLNKKGKELEIATLFGSANQACNALLEENYLPDIYIADAVSCAEIPQNKIVRSTAPRKRTNDLMNHQILVNCMIGRTEVLYSKEEMLGMLANRYESPNICKSVVRVLYSTCVILEIPGIRERWRRCYPEVKIEHLFGQTLIEANPADNEFKGKYYREIDGKEFFPVKSISLILKGMYCSKYCNTKLAKISGDAVNLMRTKVIELGVDSQALKNVLAELLASKSEEWAPYDSHENGTEVTLKNGVELQLQISQTPEPSGEFHHRLRLLRIGEDCHLCLTHLKSPRREFMCNRGDVREFITSVMTKNMKKDICENMLSTVTLNGIMIEWKNEYFYGGIFHTGCKISVRNLLCIRKEIYNDQDKILFVWNCHGVVSKTSENKVEFLVCSLSQDESSVIGKKMCDSEGYTVEVIYVENY